MNIMINIECDTITELVAHLDEMKRKVKKQATVNNVLPDQADFPIGTHFEDDNCYGSHELDVIQVIKRKPVNTGQ